MLIENLLTIENNVPIFSSDQSKKKYSIKLISFFLAPRFSFFSMAGEHIINKYKISSTITHQINNKGDDDDDNESQDLILNEISERTDRALTLINSCNLFILNHQITVHYYTYVLELVGIKLLFNYSNVLLMLI